MAAHVITIFSNKGGVGKTLVCVNTAVCLAIANKKTLLLDLDFQAGQDMARMLNIAPKTSIVDLLPDIEKAQDANAIRKLAIAHPCGLDFMTAVINIRQVGHITPDNIKLFFKRVITAYDYVIVDVGKTFTETLMSVLDMSNLILLIATPDILSVYQIKWGVEVLQSQHFSLKMLQLVLNRSESHGGVAWQEVKEAIGCEIVARIPSDGKTVGVALNRGVPVCLDSPKSKVAQAFMQLAKDLENESLYLNTSDVVRVRPADAEVKTIGFWEKFGIVETHGYGPDKYKPKKEENELDHLKRKIHEQLIDRMNLQTITPAALADPEQAALIKKQAERVIVELLVEESASFIPSYQDRSRLVTEIVNEALGLGPLEDLLADAEITDIMVNNKDEIYVEKFGKILLTNKRFVTNQQVRSIIDRIIAPLGRRIDESTPMVDARLPDGSRINAIIPPLALSGPMITIRKFGLDRYGMDDLLNRFKSISPEMTKFLQAAVLSRQNILVSGGTGSGKTTLLNIVSSFIPDGERIISIEDAAELKLTKSHWARLETRSANVEGKGAITIRDLFINTLRMRPDRIIIGECRGAEVLDMLQAMNTGHDGSLTTLHANSTHDAITRLNTLILLSGVELPLRAVYEMLSSALDVIIQINRFSDGSRKITAVTEITGRIVDGFPELKDVFVFEHKGINKEGKILGDFRATGYIPQCFDTFLKRGIDISDKIFSTNPVAEP
ncbi:MAG: ATPase, T2SS/T4P/T4SS family [Candidatus Omnitrophota bacterium]